MSDTWLTLPALGRQLLRDRRFTQLPDTSGGFAHNPDRMAKPPAITERRLSTLLLVVTAYQRIGRLVDRELSADGVEPDDYALLGLIGVRGPIRLTEVASVLGMRLTTVSDAVRRLEARGHVLRLQNPDDGRSWLFELSAAGDEEWRRGWPALRRVQASLGRRLEDEEAVRAALLELSDAAESALTET
jgi:DNA-binding MarR family transcriptional regulator